MLKACVGWNFFQNIIAGEVRITMPWLEKLFEINQRGEGARLLGIKEYPQSRKNTFIATENLC